MGNRRGHERRDAADSRDRGAGSPAERAAGRSRLGSLPPLLYGLARGPGYNSIFSDITRGTSSHDPDSAVGRSPAGGAAQRGYDLATGLGSLKAAAFADAVASQPAPPAP